MRVHCIRRTDALTTPHRRDRTHFIIHSHTFHSHVVYITITITMACNTPSPHCTAYPTVLYWIVPFFSVWSNMVISYATRVCAWLRWWLAGLGCDTAASFLE